VCGVPSQAGPRPARRLFAALFWLVDRPILTMYHNAMEEDVRDEIAAAAAAHHELGAEYDSAVAESLVDRIGAEIDKRIDARLGSPRSDSRSPAESSPSRRILPMLISAGVGAGITGIVAMIANRANTGTNSGAVDIAVIWVWGIVAIAGLGVVLRAQAPRLVKLR
jgi:hypothetical protein